MILEFIREKVSAPIYYHRNYNNDVPKIKSEELQENSWTIQYQRIALTALPFISLYKPLSFPLSLVMGGLRTFTCYEQLVESIRSGESKEIPYSMLQTSVAIASLAGTVLAHPLGMLISTGHDLTIEVVHLIEHLKKSENQKAMEDCFGIINNSLYFALFLYGGLEIGIASLAMQTLIGLYHSQAEFKKGHNIEGVGHLLMAMARGSQIVGQIKIYQSRIEFQKNVEKINNSEDEFLNKVHTNLKTSELGASSQFYVTNRVSIVCSGGYNFHIADYNDGTRIITCLDGEMRGYQAIAFNGSQIGESYDVQWYVNCFVHKYPKGKIYSFSDKQIVNLINV